MTKDSLIAQMWESKKQTVAFAAEGWKRFLVQDEALRNIHKMKEATADELREIARKSSWFYATPNEQKLILEKFKS